MCWSASEPAINGETNAAMALHENAYGMVRSRPCSFRTLLKVTIHNPVVCACAKKSSAKGMRDCFGVMTSRRGARELRTDRSVESRLRGLPNAQTSILSRNYAVQIAMRILKREALPTPRANLLPRNSASPDTSRLWHPKNPRSSRPSFSNTPKSPLLALCKRRSMEHQRI